MTEQQVEKMNTRDFGHLPIDPLKSIKNDRQLSANILFPQQSPQKLRYQHHVVQKPLIASQTPMAPTIKLDTNVLSIDHQLSQAQQQQKAESELNIQLRQRYHQVRLESESITNDTKDQQIQMQRHVHQLNQLILIKGREFQTLQDQLYELEKGQHLVQSKVEKANQLLQKLPNLENDQTQTIELQNEIDDMIRDNQQLSDNYNEQVKTLGDYNKQYDSLCQETIGNQIQQLHQQIEDENCAILALRADVDTKLKEVSQLQSERADIQNQLNSCKEMKSPRRNSVHNEHKLSQQAEIVRLRQRHTEMKAITMINDMFSTKQRTESLKLQTMKMDFLQRRLNTEMVMYIKDREVLNTSIEGLTQQYESNVGLIRKFLIELDYDKAFEE